jgi:[ribosomal protein S5]-alanine N-acetyltransferase
VREPLSIVPVDAKHADAIQELASHPKIAETTNIPQPYPKNGAMSWILSSLPRRMAGVEHAFVIQRSETQQVVGVTSLMSVGRCEAELGYWIGVPFWGNGYATQANRLILEFAFEEADLDLLYARPLVRNEASCRVLEKLGFEHVDTVDNIFPKWDASDKLGIYELEASDWRTAPVGDRRPHANERSTKRSVRIHR